MKFSKHHITSITPFQFTFRTRKSLREGGYWYYDCKYFTISIVTRKITFIIEV